MPMPRALAPPPKLPVKPKGPKRRPVHWDKIAPANLEQTVFSEIDPSSVVRSCSCVFFVSCVRMPACTCVLLRCSFELV